jgi:hypothetical protein
MMTTPKKLLQTLVAPPLYRAVKAMAEADGITVSELMRRLATVKAEERGLWPPPAPLTNRGQNDQHLD